MSRRAFLSLSAPSILINDFIEKSHAALTAQTTAPRQ
jgi:hypothetical protein